MMKSQAVIGKRCRNGRISALNARKSIGGHAK